MGRKERIDDALVASISASVRGGNFLSAAAASHRVHRVQLRHWLIRGREDVAKGDATVYARLVQEVEAAEGDAEAALVRMAWEVAEQRDCGHDPGMLRWLLERRHAQRWGQRAAAVEGELDNGQPTADAVRSTPTSELIAKLQVAAELLES